MYLNFNLEYMIHHHWLIFIGVCIKQNIIWQLCKGIILAIKAITEELKQRIMQYILNDSNDDNKYNLNQLTFKENEDFIRSIYIYKTSI